ncbi:hypothetical protein BDY24DRAFT_374054 [Mrakia frigida]|uniref:uncharacterized protein n=1 Tax=Mrakia frigida TaxID=29902 RepID=UPI003FCC05CE
MLSFKIGTVVKRSSSTRGAQSIPAAGSRRFKSDSSSSSQLESTSDVVVGALPQAESSSSSSSSIKKQPPSVRIPRSETVSSPKTPVQSKTSLSKQLKEAQADRYRKPGTPKPDRPVPTPSPPTRPSVSSSSPKPAAAALKPTRVYTIPKSAPTKVVEDPEKARRVPAQLLTLEEALEQPPGTVLCTQVVVDGEVEREITKIHFSLEQTETLMRKNPGIKPKPTGNRRTEKFLARDFMSGATVPVRFISFTQGPAFVRGDTVNLMNVKLDINLHVSPPLVSLVGTSALRTGSESWWTHVDPPVGEELVYESIKEILEGPLERRVNVKGRVKKVLLDRKKQLSGFYRAYEITDDSGATIHLALFSGKQGEGLPSWEVGREFELHGLRVRAPDVVKSVSKNLYKDIHLTGDWSNPSEDGRLWCLHLAKKE